MRRLETAVALVLATAWVAVMRPGPLSLPYFWDAADVYVPGAQWLVNHGFDITPANFNDDYSRGHPPLFYLLLATLFHFFGDAPTVGHLAVLPFTVLGLFGTYRLGRELYGIEVGASAAILLAVTPLYLSIGNMVLPEIPLTAVTVLALLALTRGRLGLAIALAVVAVLIKETGIFVGAAIGLAVLYDGRSSLRDPATRWRIARCALPLVVLIAFSIWQRVSVGYYVFPHHEHLLVDRPFGLEDLTTVVPSIFFWHGRSVLVVAAMAGCFAGFRLPAEPSASTSEWVPAPRAVALALVSLIVFNAGFSAKMFWLERYALPAHPAFLILASALLFGGFRALPRVARTTVCALPIGIAAFFGIIGIRSPAPADAEEHTFAYADVVRTHVAALRSLGPEDAPVLTTWPITVELSEPSLGYVERPLESLHPRHATPDSRIGSAVVNPASSQADTIRRLAASYGLAREPTRYQIGLAPTLEVYRRE